MGKLLNIPDVRQVETFDCGAAITDSVCRYFFGKKRTPSYFRRLLGTNGINGTDPRQIEAFLRCEKLKVLSGDMEVADLKTFTEMGRPVITMVTFNTNGHYIAVRGVKWGRVYYQDPEEGRQSMSVREFEECWVDFDRFGVSYRQFGLGVWE